MSSTSEALFEPVAAFLAVEHGQLEPAVESGHGWSVDWMNGFGTCGAHRFTISLSHGPYRNERLKLPKKVLRVLLSR